MPDFLLIVQLGHPQKQIGKWAWARPLPGIKSMRKQSNTLDIISRQTSPCPNYQMPVQCCEQDSAVGFMKYYSPDL